MLRFAVKNAILNCRSNESNSWKALRTNLSIRTHVNAIRWNQKVQKLSAKTGGGSNLSTMSMDDSARIHHQGKEAFVKALRTSFVLARKNKKSESTRQDKVFVEAFYDPETLPLMTRAVIEETLWSMVEEGENYPVTKVVRLLPHDLCNNSILNAGILAFGRVNKPNKVTNCEKLTACAEEIYDVFETAEYVFIFVPIIILSREITKEVKSQHLRNYNYLLTVVVFLDAAHIAEDNDMLKRIDLFLMLL